MNLEGFVMGLLKQVPALAVLAYIVFIFLKHLAHRDEVMRKIGDGCHEVQKESHTVMREVSSAMGENTTAMREVTSALRTLNGGDT